jgi:hypothetical protein
MVVQTTGIVNDSFGFNLQVGGRLCYEVAVSLLFYPARLDRTAGGVFTQG